MSISFYRDVTITSSNSFIVTGGASSTYGYSVGSTAVITSLGFFTPVTSTSGAAANNSIFYCSELSKLTYKDSNGTANALY